VCGGGERIEGVVGIKTLSLKKKKKSKNLNLENNCGADELL